MNDVIKNMVERRSIRKFKPDQITDEQLQDILTAGLYAASGMNKQPVRFVVIQDKETRDQLSKMNAAIMGAEIDPFYGAPTVIVVLADKSGLTPFEDGCLALGNMLNAAHSVGVDSCWVHRAQQEFDSEEGKALLKKWGLEGDFQGIGHCILGYRDCEYPQPTQKNLDRVVRV